MKEAISMNCPKDFFRNYYLYYIKRSSGGSFDEYSRKSLTNTTEKIEDFLLFKKTSYNPTGISYKVQFIYLIFNDGTLYDGTNYKQKCFCTLRIFLVPSPIERIYCSLYIVIKYTNLHVIEILLTVFSSANH